MNLFIGYDRDEPVAYHTLVHSILRRASIPVSITPLVRPALASVGYTRLRGPLESTEFSMTRFLVPYLSRFTGQSVFMDSDMLCRVDLALLLATMWSEEYRDKAVVVCQHDYAPTSTTKFLNRPQTAYPKKNWSSLMVFNNAKCRALTPGYVNTATGLQLHRFEWLTAESQIGALPFEWNWLVGDYPANPDAKILHFTNGGPWFEATAQVDGADEWRAERDAMLGLDLHQGVSHGVG